MCARRLTGDEALALSPIARRMLTALGYDVSRLRLLDASEVERQPRQIRLFEDPRTGAQIHVTDSYTHEAPGVAIAINPHGDRPGARETLAFHYDHLRRSLLSVRGVDENAPPELITTNLLTQRTFEGRDAFESIGNPFSFPTVGAGPELQRKHEAIVRALSQPVVTPAPGLTPSPGR